MEQETLEIRSIFPVKRQSPGFREDAPTPVILPAERLRSDNMVKHLFADFMQNETSYVQAENLWRRVCREVIDESSFRDDWKPWLRTRFADGTYLEKGNPVFNLKSLSRSKAIRIIQQPPSCSEIEIKAWTDCFSDNNETIDELVISCELSDEAILVAQQLIAAWLNWQASRGDFGEYISKTLAD